jgi:hypothetical protein
MTQEEVNILYELTIIIHEDKWFGKRKSPRDREEVQKWVTMQLANNLNIYTTPCGSSWGVLTTKENFDKYWSEHRLKNKYFLKN